MPGEPLALSTVPPPATADTDYDAICAAVTATARGRWFLDEFAKRNRHSDTSQVLTAIARMEAAVVGDRAQQASRQAHQEVRIELLEMARSIAQTRAAVAESRPAPSQHLAAESAGESAPDVAAAAERLRQIAWTMRACGIDLPASDQIGQIADTILSADALRNLGDQRAHKLTEALHYLEHRIDRMLDGHLAAAAAVAADDAAELATDDPVSTANGANDNDHHADAVVLTLTAPPADVATTLETEARTESPLAAEDDSAAVAFVAAADAAEFPMDDDVVLTVTDSAVEPAPIPTTNFGATALPDERAGLEAAPVATVQVAAAEVEDDSDTEAAFGALAFEPLVVVPAVAASPGGLPAVAAQEPAQGTVQETIQEPAQGTADQPVATAADVIAGEPAAALPQASNEELNAIAMQVEQDLDQLGRRRAGRQHRRCRPCAAGGACGSERPRDRRARGRPR